VSAVFRITPGGTITTIIEAVGDGLGHTVRDPEDLAVDAAGNAFLLSRAQGGGNPEVFKISPTGVVSAILDADGDGAGNELALPGYATVDGIGNVLVAPIQGTSPFGTDNVFRVSANVGCPAAPVAGCETADRGRLLLVQSSSRARNRLTWKFGPGAIAPGAFGDPVTTDDYRLCLYAGADGVVASALLPAGGTCGTAPCWKANGNPPGSKGFRYKSKTKTPDGVSKLVLRSTSGKITLAAKGYQLAPAGLPRPAPLDLLVQLQAGNGECWESSFADGDQLQNTESKFKAKSN
jgi:hypothetical protein